MHPTAGENLSGVLAPPTLVGVLEATPDTHELINSAKSEIRSGADLIEVSGDLPDTVFEDLRRADVAWVARIADIPRAVQLADLGASAIRWRGSATEVAELGAQLTAVPFISTDGPWRTDDWRELDTHQLHAHGINVQGDEMSRLVLVNLEAETDAATVAAQVTLALEFGVTAIRTTRVRAARRAAYVVRAIESAR